MVLLRVVKAAGREGEWKLENREEKMEREEFPAVDQYIYCRVEF